MQPMQSSVTEYVISALHLPAGQRLWRCASYSSRKYFRVERTGFGAVLPNPHKLDFFTISPRCCNSSKICFFTLAGAQSLKDIEHSPRAYSAESAFTAGLVLGELQKIPGDINHTVRFIQSHHTAGTHHRPDTRSTFRNQLEYAPVLPARTRRRVRLSAPP